MKRKMVFVGISYAIGLFCAFNFNLALFGVVIALWIIACVCFARRRLYSHIICCLVCFVLGFAYYVVYDVVNFSSLKCYDDKQLTISGRVVDIKENGDSLTLCVKTEIDDKTTKVLIGADNTNVEIGDEIEAFGTVSTFRTTYLFDSANYYNSNGIVLAMYSPQYLYVYDGDYTIINAINSYVDDAKYNIRRSLPDVEGELMCAMLFGDKSGIDNSGKSMFYRSGIGHIMATSGLHLVVAVTMIMLFLSPVLKKNPLTNAIVAIVMGALFVICAKFSASVIRAYIMLVLYYCSPIFFKKSDSLNSLCISIVIMTLPCPYIISSPSFILSVSGVLSTSVFAKRLCLNVKNKIIKALCYPVCVSLCIIPASILYFDEISLISPIANILLIPLCTFALCCALVSFAFTNIMFVSQPMLILGGFGCKLVFESVNIFSRLKFAQIPISSIYIKSYIWFIALGILVYLIIGNERDKIAGFMSIGIFGLFLLSTTSLHLESKSDFVAVYSDNGGTVSIVKSDDNIFVIDAGADKSTDFAIKYLSSKGIYDIDCIYMACDTNSAESKWSSCTQFFDISTFVDATAAYDNGDVNIRHNKQYAVFCNDISLCITDDENEYFGCRYGYLLGKKNSESFISENNVKAFAVTSSNGNIKQDYLEYVEEE